MKKVTVNGIGYLGDIKESKGDMVLTDAMRVDGVNRATIQMYMKRKNMDELNTIRFAGMGTSVSVCELSDEEEMIYDICKRAMKLAKKKGEQGIANSLFDDYLGKL